jgi:GNAT superfamily N-acetyltransferase
MVAVAVAEDRVRVRELGRPGDLGWVVMAHGEVYAQEFGWDQTFEALVGQIVADYANDRDQRREGAWIAEVDGQRAGCVFCVRGDSVDTLRTAKLRILLVHPAARGLGIGGLLVDTCVNFARAVGYQRIQLWTNDPLVAARHIYLARGFTLIEEQPHRSFGVHLIGQIYERSLVPQS